MIWLKDKLEKQPFVHGMWITSGSFASAEVAAMAGYDWALFDMEHGFAGELEILRMLQSVARTNTAPVVRVASSGSDMIKKVLDYGASAIMAPMINTAAEATAFVRLLRYAPQGVRGLTGGSRAADYGYDFPNYFRDANSHITGIAQIETAQAVENADAIAAVDGIDILFIGHSDLSLSLGVTEQFTSPVLMEAEAKVLAACAKHGKKAGMLMRPSISIADYHKKGFAFIALSTDVGCLKQQFNQLLAAAKEAN